MQPARLLVVDDAQPHLEALSRALGYGGHVVTCHSCAQAALEVLQTTPVDVLLCDLSMPGIDGLELTRLSLDIDPDIVPVLMTSEGSVETAVAAMKIGALDYIRKPCRPDGIRSVIARAMQVRRLRLENRRRTQQLKERVARLETANQELDTYAVQVAHDLRSPLSLVKGFAGALANSAASRLDDQEMGYLRHIEAAAVRADELVTGMLEFARLGEAALARVPVHLGAVAEKAWACVTTDPLHRRDRVAWVVDRLPVVIGDRLLLEQAFINLLSNALKFTRKVAQPRIEVRAVWHPESVEIRVSDNGVGFEPSQGAQLFLPFSRLHQHAEYEGTGMGLVNVRRIMERHGGLARCEAHDGGGATFALVFRKEGLFDEPQGAGRGHARTA